MIPPCRNCDGAADLLSDVLGGRIRRGLILRDKR